MGTHGPSSYSLRTSRDGTAVQPASGAETIVSAGPQGSGSHWSITSPAAPGQSAALNAPSAPASLQGRASGGYMCTSTASETVSLSWGAVAHATSYVILQSTTSGGTYLAASPAPVFSGTTATITYTTAVTEYYQAEALIGTSWVSVQSGIEVNGSVSPGYVVLSTTSPKCTNN